LVAGVLAKFQRSDGHARFPRVPPGAVMARSGLPNLIEVLSILFSDRKTGPVRYPSPPVKRICHRADVTATLTATNFQLVERIP
jgi:hypothetical protein